MEIKWSECYSVKNEIIDVQHRKLFSIVNELDSAIINGNGLIQIEKTLEEMSTYAWLHFRTEEDVLLKSNFKALEQHKEMHNQFKKVMLNTIKDVQNKKTMKSVVSVHQFLYKWLNKHVLEEDLKYCDDIE